MELGRRPGKQGFAEEKLGFEEGSGQWLIRELLSTDSSRRQRVLTELCRPHRAPTTGPTLPRVSPWETDALVR